MEQPELVVKPVTYKTLVEDIFSKERQIQNHGTSNTNYLTQLAKVENQCKDIFKQCSQVLATVDKVEANGKYFYEKIECSL